MTDLSTTYLGLNLKNPLVASASPVSKNIDKARKLEEAGVSAIVHVHVITSAVALVQLEDLLAPPAFVALLAHAWHAGAALIGTWRPAAVHRSNLAPIDRAALITRALANRDEHAIKLVDAASTGFDRFGDPMLLEAADRLLVAITLKV